MNQHISTNRYATASRGERHAYQTLDRLAKVIIAECDEIERQGGGVPHDGTMTGLHQRILALLGDTTSRPVQ